MQQHYFPVSSTPYQKFMNVHLILIYQDVKNERLDTKMSMKIKKFTYMKNVQLLMTNYGSEGSLSPC